MTHDGAYLRKRLKRWYVEHGRHELPWRLTHDPYAVLVSEVMLQQTQVDRVVPYFLEWMERWPNAALLAEASPADVIRAWAGLGYNRRALNLHRAARLMTDDGVPGTVAGLRDLPGVGPYTAAAIASFAFEQPVAVADTNIARLLARVLAGEPSHRAVGRRRLQALAESLLPKQGGRDHNLTLMDLGAAVCLARNPRCEACPLSEKCAWRLSGFRDTGAPRKPAVRFVDTARFARGRIVDALRNSPSLSTSELRGLLPPPHREAVNSYLLALEREGLACKTPSGDWALPSTAPAATAG